MKKSILEIYALSTCFVAIIFLIISLSEAAYDFVGAVNPDFTMLPYQYNRLQSNERYRQYCCKKDRVIKMEEAITKLRTDAYALELRMESRINLQHLLKNIINILLASIVLFMHWKLSKSARGD